MPLRRVAQVVAEGRASPPCCVARPVVDYPGNGRYPHDTAVVEVPYPLPAGIDGDDVEPSHLRRYRFPVSRLLRAAREEVWA